MWASILFVTTASTETLNCTILGVTCCLGGEPKQQASLGSWYTN